MDGKGAWRDNVFVERLWRSLKHEEVYLRAYASVSEARVSIERYLASTTGGALIGSWPSRRPIRPSSMRCRQSRGGVTKGETTYRRTGNCHTNRANSRRDETPSEVETTGAGVSASMRNLGFSTTFFLAASSPASLSGARYQLDLGVWRVLKAFALRRFSASSQVFSHAGRANATWITGSGFGSA